MNCPGRRNPDIFLFLRVPDHSVAPFQSFGFEMLESNDDHMVSLAPRVIESSKNTVYVGSSLQSVMVE